MARVDPSALAHAISVTLPVPGTEEASFDRSSSFANPLATTGHDSVDTGHGPHKPPPSWARLLLTQELELAAADVANAESKAAAIAGGHGGSIKLNESRLLTPGVVDDIRAFARKRWKQQERELEELLEEQRLVPPTVPWTTSMAMRHRPGRVVRLVPRHGRRTVEDLGIERGKDGTLIFRDDETATLLDPTHRCCPRATELCMVFHLQWLTPVATFAMALTVPFMPIVLFEMTETTQMLATDSVRPWSAEVGLASMIILSVYSVLATYLQLAQVLFLTHQKMMRRLWARQKALIATKMIVAWAYTIAATTIQPNFAHLLWLVCNAVLFSSTLILTDALAITTHLRFAPQMVERMISSRHGGKKHNSRWSKLKVLFGLFTVVFDVARHQLLVELSLPKSIITLNLTNPFTQQKMAITNQSVATGFFWTNVAFFIQVMYRMLRRKTLQ